MRIRRIAARPGAGEARLAFTVVELVLVMVLLATLTGGVIVSLAGRQRRYALQMAGEDLAAAIECARQQASLRRAPHRVRFFLDGGAYRVEMSDGRPETFERASGAAGQTRRLGNGIVLESIRSDTQSSGRIESIIQEPFAPFRGEVTLLNDQGLRAVLLISPGCPEVRIHDPQ